MNRKYRFSHGIVKVNSGRREINSNVIYLKNKDYLMGNELRSVHFLFIRFATITN